MYPPPPPKKMGTGAKVGIGCGGAFAALLLIGIIGAAVGGGADTKAPAKADKVAAAPKEEGQAKSDAKPAEKKTKPKPAAPKSAADQLKAFVAKHGTPAEKTAATHITKVQGAGDQNDILDTADIYTDYTGGMIGPHAADGKLIASAFADWKNSKNGLVTIYDAKGEILSNGKF
jgi:hypothetical protein